MYRIVTATMAFSPVEKYETADALCDISGVDAHVEELCDRHGWQRVGLNGVCHICSDEYHESLIEQSLSECQAMAAELARDFLPPYIDYDGEPID